MKFSMKVLLAVFFIQLTAGCSAKMHVSKNDAGTVRQNYFHGEKLPGEELSMSSVRELYNQGQYSLTGQVLDKLEISGEASVEYHIYRGNICKKQNRLNAAIGEYNTAIGLLKTSPADSLYRMVYGGLADAYYSQNDFKMSSAYYREYREHGGEMSSDFIAYLESFEENPYALNKDVSKTSVKMNYRFGFPYIKVKINNSKETELVVDTGANINLLTQGLARKFNVRRVAKTKVSMQTRVFGASTGIIDSLQLGDIVVKNVPVLIADSIFLRAKLFMNNLFAPHMKIKGIIGLNVLKNFNVTFDYKNEILELDIPKNQIEPDEYAGNIYFVNDLIQYPVHVNNVSTVNLLMDTGVFSSYIYTSPQAFKTLEESDIETTLGVKFCSFLILPMICPEKKITNATIGLGEYRLSKSVIRRKKIRYPQAIEGLIGNRFFEQFRTSIDFVNMLIELEPYE
jgi:predicted aspartyl protease